MKNYQHLETQDEQNMRFWADAFILGMGWEGLTIARYKLAPTKQWRGYSMRLAYGEGDIYMVLISSRTDQGYHTSERRLWHTVAHELVHLRLSQIGYPNDKAFAHGKVFKNLCKEIEAKSDGELIYKGLTR